MKEKREKTLELSFIVTAQARPDHILYHFCTYL